MRRRRKTTALAQSNTYTKLSRHPERSEGSAPPFVILRERSDRRICCSGLSTRRKQGTQIFAAPRGHPSQMNADTTKERNAFLKKIVVALLSARICGIRVHLRAAFD